MNTPADTTEHELRQYLVQIRVPDDPATLSWIPSNEDEVDSVRFFVTDQLPAGHLELLQLASLSTAWSTHSITVGLLDMTTEQMAEEGEDGEQYIFNGSDRITVLAQTDAQSLISWIAKARWIRKEEFPGPCAAIIESQFVKIRD